MALKLVIDRGGEYLLPFAKRMLAKLKRGGSTIASKVIHASSGERIYVEVLPGLDRIKITGKRIRFLVAALRGSFTGEANVRFFDEKAQLDAVTLEGATGNSASYVFGGDHYYIDVFADPTFTFATFYIYSGGKVFEEPIAGVGNVAFNPFGDAALKIWGNDIDPETGQTRLYLRSFPSGSKKTMELPYTGPPLDQSIFRFQLSKPLGTERFYIVSVSSLSPETKVYSDKGLNLHFPGVSQPRMSVSELGLFLAFHSSISITTSLSFFRSHLPGVLDVPAPAGNWESVSVVDTVSSDSTHYASVVYRGAGDGDDLNVVYDGDGNTIYSQLVSQNGAISALLLLYNGELLFMTGVTPTAVYAAGVLQFTFPTPLYELPFTGEAINSNLFLLADAAYRFLLFEVREFIDEPDIGVLVGYEAVFFGTNGHFNRYFLPPGHTPSVSGFTTSKSRAAAVVRSGAELYLVDQFGLTVLTTNALILEATINVTFPPLVFSNQGLYQSSQERFYIAFVEAGAPPRTFIYSSEDAAPVLLSERPMLFHGSGFSFSAAFVVRPEGDDYFFTDEAVLQPDGSTVTEFVSYRVDPINPDDPGDSRSERFVRTVLTTFVNDEFNLLRSVNHPRIVGGRLFH